MATIFLVAIVHRKVRKVRQDSNDFCTNFSRYFRYAILRVKRKDWKNGDIKLTRGESKPLINVGRLGNDLSENKK